MPTRSINLFDIMFYFSSHIVLTKYARSFAWQFIVLVSLTLSGCGQMNSGPNKKEAEAAIRGMIGQALGIQLPPGCQLANVTVNACVWQERPEGHVCDVTLVSTEVPVIGAISIPMRLRFAKRGDQWKGFLF